MSGQAAICCLLLYLSCKLLWNILTEVYCTGSIEEVIIGSAF